MVWLVPTGGEDRVLAIYGAKSLHGPWAPHHNASFPVEAATTVGRVFTWQNRLHRLGRACRRGRCGKLEALQVGGGLPARWVRRGARRP